MRTGTRRLRQLRHRRQPSSARQQLAGAVIGLSARSNTFRRAHRAGREPEPTGSEVVMVTRLRPVWPILALPFASGCVVAAGTSRDSSSSSFLFLFLPFALVFGMALLVRRAMRGGRRRSGRAARQNTSSTANVQVLRAELSVLADDVIRLEPQVALKDAARDDFETATHRYRVAQAALDYAKEPADLVRVQRVVDEATWSMSRARAIVEGRRLPSPPQSLRRPGPDGEPAVDVDERERPVY